MNALAFPDLTRRGFLGGAGALIVSFAIPADAQEGRGPANAEPPKLRGSLADTPSLDAWIRIDADGKITVFTGKAELGQGTKTSLRQIAAEELEVEPAAIHLVTADTALTPNEGNTAGSQTIQNSLGRGPLQIHVQRRVHAQTTFVNLIAAIFVFQITANLLDVVRRQ